MLLLNIDFQITMMLSMQESYGAAIISRWSQDFLAGVQAIVTLIIFYIY